MKRFLQLLIITLFALSATFMGCSGNELKPAVEDNAISGETLSSTTVTIGSLKGPTSIGMVKMFDESPSLGKNIETKYEIVESPDLMVSKLLSGEMDFATLPTNVAARLYNKGTDYKLAAVIGHGVLYLLYQNKVINTWEDLANEKINVPSKGSTPDIVLRYLLEKNNLYPGNGIELDYSVNHIEISQLMISGKVNIAILPEPFVTLVLNKNDCSSIAFDIENEWKKIQNGLSMPMSCLVVNSTFAENYPDAVNLFLTEYNSSIDWVNNNLAEAGLLVEKYNIGMDAKTAEEAIPRCSINFVSSGQSKEIVNNYIQILFEFSPEDVGDIVPDENFYY